MIEKEKQVCNLELAKKLKELGVEQGSVWYWLYDSQHGMHLRLVTKDQCNLCGWKYQDDENYSAFTSEELGFLLRKERGFYIPYLDMNNRGWISPASRIPDTEANARAKMLIYLLEKR